MLSDLVSAVSRSNRTILKLPRTLETAPIAENVRARFAFIIMVRKFDRGDKDPESRYFPRMAVTSRLHFSLGFGIIVCFSLYIYIYKCIRRRHFVRRFPCPGLIFNFCFSLISGSGAHARRYFNKRKQNSFENLPST